MKKLELEKPENGNYCATVVRISNIIPLENCDNVVATSIFGFQAIVGKDTRVGDIGIVFTAETQLSDDFCHFNSLYRHGEKNADQGKKGYMEDNRRIRAIKFRGNASSCFFTSLDSLAWTGIDTSLLEVGMEFDSLDGKEICRKFKVPVKAVRGQASANKSYSRVDKRHMPEHIETDAYFKWGHEIPDETSIIVTQKIHGTSIRIGNTIVSRKLGLFERILRKMGVRVAETEHDMVYGSRKVIKDVNNPYQNHFYGSDIWTREGQKLNGLIPENYIVYAELVGWTGELPIQKNYTYSVEKPNAELYIYRIAIINSQGMSTDLSWDNVMEFCRNSGLKHVPEIWRGKKKDFDVQRYMDKRYFDSGLVQCLQLSNPEMDLVDEGVCVRVEGLTPRIFKAKAPKFFEHESSLLDTGEQDLESSQSI